MPSRSLVAGAKRGVVLSGSVITILSGKGGCGKTTIASNLAVVLSDGGASSVCLVDLDLALGDIASSLGITPSGSLLGAITADGHLDLDRLPELLTHYLDGVDCLLAPVGPGESEKIPAQVIEELLIALRAGYDYVVIDTPARISSRVLAALDSSDHHVLLTTPEYPAVKRLRLTIDMLALLARRGATTSIVVNRADAVGSLPDDAIDAITRAPIAGRVPFSPAVAVSINAQTPLAVSDPLHPVAIAIRRFAVMHLGLPPKTVVGCPGRGRDRDPPR